MKKLLYVDFCFHILDSLAIIHTYYVNCSRVLKTSDSRRPKMIGDNSDKPNSVGQNESSNGVASCAKCDSGWKSEMITRGLKLISDPMSRVFFKGEKSLVEYVIRLVTGNKEISIVEMSQQVVVTNANGRSAQFDILARDVNGKIYNIEFQSRREKAIIQRAFFYASMLFIDAFKSGVGYEKIPEVCVIFLAEHGEGCHGKLVEHFTTVGANGEVDDWPAEFYFVSGALRVESDVGIMMQDLCFTNPYDLRDPEFRRRMNALMHQKIGRRIMCEAQEKWENELMARGIIEGRQEGLDEGIKLGQEKLQRDIVRAMIAQNLGDSIITCTTGMPLASVQAMRNEMEARL